MYPWTWYVGEAPTRKVQVKGVRLAALRKSLARSLFARTLLQFH